MTQKLKSSAGENDGNLQWINGVLEYLERKRYSKTSIRFHRYFYSHFLRFLKTNHRRVINQKNINDFLIYWGVASNGVNDNHYHNMIRCVMRKLLEFKETGNISIRKTNSVKIPRCFEDFYPMFIKEQLERKEYAPRTIKKGCITLQRFLAFLSVNGVNSLAKIQREHFALYVGKRQRDFGIRSALLATEDLRMFLRLMIAQGHVSEQLADSVPRIPDIRRKKLPTIWSDDEIQQLLSVIDIDTPLGKRDYAIILFAIRYGMRIGDICSLKFENINWEKGVISFVMQKTKKSLELPMTEEIGKALIDYLKNGRPDVKENRIIFLRHNAPFDPIKGSYCIISKYRSLAGISITPGGKKGFHSLRFTLATRLHEANTPFSVIAAVLGHSSIETTRIYAKANIEMLRSVALDCEEVDHV